VHESSWLVGTKEYSGLNEPFPYRINGLTSLAYALDNARIKSNIVTALNYVLEQKIASDGWIEPQKCGPGGGDRLIWAFTTLPVFLGRTTQSRS
jgi:hypothetical protein